MGRKVWVWKLGIAGAAWLTWLPPILALRGGSGVRVGTGANTGLLLELEVVEAGLGA
jgi:hypothetical protein